MSVHAGIHHFEKVTAFCLVQWRDATIVDHEEIHLGETAKQFALTAASPFQFPAQAENLSS
jgi:flagellar assembly factor FliW